jgi:NAD(P)-dependent dehydrogenase (short-subunit alcohol dehydrogenase family)
MSEPLLGKVVAMIGHGTPLDRAIAVRLAEAGADVAIATEQPGREQEFATASIANEIWAIGREQFSYVLDAANGTAVAGYGAEVVARLGRCDALVLVELESEGSIASVLAPAFVRRAGRDVPCVVVGPAGGATTTVADMGDEGETANAVVECVREHG